MGSKFVVVKKDDITKYLSGGERTELARLLGKVLNGRLAEGKKSNSYAVVNLDEPYANDVVTIMRNHGHWND